MQNKIKLAQFDIIEFSQLVKVQILLREGHKIRKTPHFCFEITESPDKSEQ